MLITKVDNRTNLGKKTRAMLVSALGDRVFDTQIRQNIKITDSQINNKPINFFDKSSTGYIEYLEFAKEVVKRVK